MRTLIFGVKLSHESDADSIHRARGRVPPLLQMTAGHGGTESKDKKQESDQTVCSVSLCGNLLCTCVVNGYIFSMHGTLYFLN